MNLDQFKKDNKFLMLALDHRGSFKKLINPQNPDAVLDEEVINVKASIISALEDQFSGILIDEIFGLHAYPQRTKAFLLPLEESGYEQEGNERITKIQYSVDEIKKKGASGAKLLLYFNPFLNSKDAQVETAKKVVEDCKKTDFPLFLEIVTYTPSHEETMDEREKLIMESLKLFLKKNIIPDVFKLEYPGSALGCQTITAILGNIPWILLTRGVTFDEFVPQLEEASIRGCQGFLAGRALWQEVCRMRGEEKEYFLKTTLPARFKRISEIVCFATLAK